MMMLYSKVVNLQRKVVIEVHGELELNLMWSVGCGSIKDYARLHLTLFFSGMASNFYLILEAWDK